MRRAVSIIRWTALKSFIRAHYSMARNGTSEFVLSDARVSFERDLRDTKNKNARLLINDEIFNDYFQRAIADKNSSFFNPNVFGYPCP